ncbi:MAG: rcp1 2 [Segetibacter sp.]|nr:rcp1 2 [Segetibacter sp.]
MSVSQVHILLADDDYDDCNFFKLALKELPTSPDLTIVSDGDMLMQYLEDNIDHLPSVLFLDINMPRKNGYVCLEEIKANEKLKDLPVIMFSTSNEKDKIDLLFNKGANIYIRKPSSFPELVQAIHHAIPIVTENIFSNGHLKYIFNP